MVAASNGEKPPQVTKTMNFLMLPDDLILTCLARVSRLYYPTLSLVSKRFRSLVASLDCYNIRELLGCTESCFYVCLRFPRELIPRWFTICRKPTQIIHPNPNPNPNPRWFTQCFALYRALMNRIPEKDKKPYDNVMVSIPTPNSPSSLSWWERATWDGVIADGYRIYKIGGYKIGLTSSRVFFLDCRSHKWHEAPSIPVAQKSPHVSVLDGKIYVVDWSKNFDAPNGMECFDPITQIWEHVPGPDAEIRGRSVWRILAIEGNLYLYGDKSVVYKPKENRWDSVETCFGWEYSCSCVINNVLYCYMGSRKLKWYDFEGRCWRALKGFKKLPELPKGYNRVRLAGYGGKIAVLWETDVVDEEKNIWCAQISLERCKEHEILGKVDWCGVVLTVPESCTFLQFLAVTV